MLCPSAPARRADASATKPTERQVRRISGGRPTGRRGDRRPVHARCHPLDEGTEMNLDLRHHPPLGRGHAMDRAELRVGEAGEIARPRPERALAHARRRGSPCRSATALKAAWTAAPAGASSNCGSRLAEGVGEHRPMAMPDVLQQPGFRQAAPAKLRHAEHDGLAPCRHRAARRPRSAAGRQPRFERFVPIRRVRLRRHQPAAWSCGTARRIGQPFPDAARR